MKIKIRDVLALLFAIGSMIITPFAVAHAYEFRGYMAFGGEYLVFPMGLVLAFVVLELGHKWDEFMRRRQIKHVLRQRRLGHGVYIRHEVINCRCRAIPVLVEKGDDCGEK